MVIRNRHFISAQSSAGGSCGRQTVTIGRRNFAVAGPATWNSLPVDLRISKLSRNTFAKKLKTHLFGCERSSGLL